MNKTAVMVLVVSGALGCAKDSPSGPKQEVAQTQIKLDLPALPEFKLPEPYSDGSHSVTDMRLRSARYLEQKVKITGYVIFNYNLATCARELGAKLARAASALGKPPASCQGVDEAECALRLGMKIVEATPDKCTRPYFYLADTPGASRDKAIEVVDVPRPLTRDEQRFPDLVALAKERPAPPDIDPLVEKQAKVVVEGKWTTKSGLGFTNSAGLLEYESIAPAN